MRALLSPIARLAREWYRRMRHASTLLYLDTWVLEGQERVSGEPFCFAFCGSETLKAYQANKFFRAGFKEHFLGRRFVYTLAWTVSRSHPDCNIAIFEFRESDARAYKYFKSPVRIPVWIPVALDIKGSLEASLRKSRFRSISKKLQANELTYEIAKGGEAFDDFYNNMYLPHALARHGSATELTKYARLKTGYERGDLVLIKHAGKAVGGSLIEYGEDGKPRLLEMGVRDGSEAYIRMGVPDAAYFYSFAHILEKGGATVILGNSHGFLSDGALSYKLSLGAFFLGRHHESTGLLHYRFMKRSVGLRNFLMNNSFVIIDQGRRYCATFFSTDSDAAGKDITALLGDYCRKTIGQRVFLMRQTLGGSKRDGLEVFTVCHLFCPSEDEQNSGALESTQERREARCIRCPMTTAPILAKP